MLFPIIGTCVLASPGGQRGFFQAWYGATFSAVAGPTDYLHFWNPASLDETDQGPGGNDADSVNFDPDSADGWNMGTDNSKYVLLDGPITNGTSYTITAWIKPDITAMNANANGGWIVSDRTQSGSTRDFQFMYRTDLTPDQYRLNVWNSSGTALSEINTNVFDNVWQHLAAVVDSNAGTLEIFVNGVSDGSSSLTTTPNDTYSGQATIGASSWDPDINAGAKYHGSIGKVRFYQRALTQQEILDEIAADGNSGP